MKASKFTDAQKAFIMRQGEEGPRLLRFAGEQGSARRRILTGRKICRIDAVRDEKAAEA